MLELDPIQTLAAAGLTLFAGYGLRRAVPLLARYNLPAPVVGGLAVALVLSLLRARDVTPIKFDNTLQKVLLSAFFTAIGFRVSVTLLRRGGISLVVFLLLSAIGAVLQNAVGISTALLLGQPALFGVLCGSVTLAGGPATGLAFAPQFEQAGVSAAEPIAVVSAIFGIVSAGLLAAPLSTILIDRLRRREGAISNPTLPVAPDVVETCVLDAANAPDYASGSYAMLKSVAVLLVALAVGTWVSAWLTAHVMTLPIYMGGMLTAAAIRNVDDVLGCFRLSQRTLDVLGDVALSFFLAMALMTLELWKLTEIARPLTVILLIQIAFMMAYSIGPVFASMGRDYDAAVTAGGFFGFMIGITANAIASMDSIVKRYGPAPVAYLVVPVVGAFFIDFVNSLLIQGCLNLFK